MCLDRRCACALNLRASYGALAFREQLSSPVGGGSSRRAPGRALGAADAERAEPRPQTLNKQTVAASSSSAVGELCVSVCVAANFQLIARELAAKLEQLQIQMTTVLMSSDGGGAAECETG